MTGILLCFSSLGTVILGGLLSSIFTSPYQFLSAVFLSPSLPSFLPFLFFLLFLACIFYIGPDPVTTAGLINLGQPFIIPSCWFQMQTGEIKNCQEGEMDEQQINGGNCNLLRHSLPLAWLIIRGIRNVFLFPQFRTLFFCFTKNIWILSLVWPCANFAGSSIIATNLGTAERSQLSLPE